MVYCVRNSNVSNNIEKKSSLGSSQFLFSTFRIFEAEKTRVEIYQDVNNGYFNRNRYNEIFVHDYT